MMGCMLLVGASVMAAPDAADQKWFEAVQKMVVKGQVKVSTPKQERVVLLKKWATEKGFTVQVTKSDSGFVLELSKSIAKN